MLTSTHNFEVIDSTLKTKHEFVVIPDQHGIVVGIKGLSQDVVFDISAGELRVFAGAGDSMDKHHLLASLTLKGNEDAGQEVPDSGS